MSAPLTRRLINVGTLLSLIASLSLCVYWYKLGIFHDIPSLQAYLSAIGLIGPLIFIAIQILQVVIPIIPGGISTAAGVLLFGPWAGFAYNYIGIAIGSCINFALARRYGKPFILAIISEATYEKYMAKTTNQRRFNWLFAGAIIAPVAPDDVLCLIAGLTKMKFSTFFWIIILGKPITIAAYSYALIVGAQWLTQWL
ncbi:TVP38/TMEM64 family protein [Lacticaseibacillus absianus]|uniref:TVP38/TMEM64 family protein n=1 Tax=Lacticaseibacillus absianus TaxID=2729623 RepID=UPI0015CE8C40|nr:TVP38/TMEM64 family protein [Lacticaseibacillus absianus]